MMVNESAFDENKHGQNTTFDHHEKNGNLFTTSKCFSFLCLSSTLESEKWLSLFSPYYVVLHDID